MASAIHSTDDRPDMPSSNERKAAPSIVGIARKKENSAEADSDTPPSNPPIIVEADRDMPGSKAMHCAAPISRARLYVIPSISLILGFERHFSTASISAAPNTTAADTMIVLKNFCMDEIFQKKAITADGKKGYQKP